MKKLFFLLCLLTPFAALAQNKPKPKTPTKKVAPYHPYEVQMDVFKAALDNPKSFEFVQWDDNDTIVMFLPDFITKEVCAECQENYDRYYKQQNIGLQGAEPSSYVYRRLHDFKDTISACNNLTKPFNLKNLENKYSYYGKMKEWYLENLKASKLVTVEIRKNFIYRSTNKFGALVLNSGYITIK